MGDILSQHDSIRERGKWISLIQEYDHDIKPINIIKGQGLANMMIERNEKALYFYKSEGVNIAHHELENKRWDLRLKVTKYYHTQDGIGWKNPDGIILKCISEEESHLILKEFHYRHCCGHYPAHTIAHKILRASYYFPTIFKDSYSYVRTFHPCHLIVRIQKLPTLPLQPTIAEAPFQY